MIHGKESQPRKLTVRGSVSRGSGMEYSRTLGFSITVCLPFMVIIGRLLFDISLEDNSHTDHDSS